MAVVVMVSIAQFCSRFGFGRKCAHQATFKLSTAHDERESHHAQPEPAEATVEAAREDICSL